MSLLYTADSIGAPIPYQAKRLSGKNISNVNYFVSRDVKHWCNSSVSRSTKIL